MIHVFKSAEKTIHAAADYFVERANQSIEATGRCCVALSGGSSPGKLYQRLASMNLSVDWSNLYFFFGDERYVGHDSPESNFKMARENLLDPLSIARDHIFPVNTELPPANAASDYEATVKKTVGSAEPEFDLILLGLGDDAHTASLFPGTPVLNEKRLLVSDVYIDKLGSHRITFTPRLINLARAVAFLVFGDSKSQAVQHVLGDATDPVQYPALLVNPNKGELHWFIDQEAASALRDDQ